MTTKIPRSPLLLARHSAMLLALAAAGCADVPAQKPFPDYNKAPDGGTGVQQPAEAAPAASAEPVAEASLLARKVETTRSTLDLAVDTTRRRLTKLKQQIVDAKQML
ncbi:hypothetical protein, partial [Inquilinus limosus]